MPKSLGLALRISTSAMVFFGYLALASVTKYGLSLLVIPLILILLSPIGERLDARFPFYREIFKGITILYCAFIPFSYLTWGALDSVILLTIYIQGNLMLHQKEERFYHYLFLMSFFLLLAACVQQPEALIGVALVGFLVSSVWSICCFRLMVETGQQTEETLAEIVPLRLENRLDADNLRSGFDVRVALNLAMVSVAAVLLTMALFVFTPRMEAGWFGNNSNFTATTGLSEEVDLMGSGTVQEDATAVMLVRFPDTPDGRYPHGEMYWRSTTFPQFQNSKWVRQELYNNMMPGIRPLTREDRVRRVARTELVRSPREGHDVVHQDVYLDTVGEYGIPVLDLVQAVGLKPESDNFSITWDRYQDFTIDARSSGTRRLSYDAWSEVAQPTPEALRAATADYSMLNERDLRMLLQQDLREETQVLAASLTEDAENVYDKAVAIEQWLSGPDFLYSLDLPELPSDFPIDAFILQTRMGHCELFASAMALMLRSVGIPTRVVNGYRGGEWSDADRAYTVRQYMAHLWVEVYFPEYGWVRFDPSPSGSQAGSSLSEFARLLSYYSLKSKMFWYQDVVGFSGGFSVMNNQPWQGFGVRLSGMDVPDPTGGGAAQIFFSLFHPIVPVAGMLFLVFLVLRRRGRPEIRRQFRQELTPEQVRVIKLYRRLRKQMVKQGADCAGKTAEELEADLIAHGWVNIPPAVQLLHAYNEVRFGGRGLSRDQYSALKQQLRHLKPVAAG